MRIKKWPSLISLTGCLLYLGLAYSYLNIWMHPGTNEGSKVVSYSYLILPIEFLVFFGSAGTVGFYLAPINRFLALLFAIPFFGLIYLISAHSPFGNTLLTIYIATIAYRLSFLLFEKSEEAKNKVLCNIIGGFLFYMLLYTLISIFGKAIPRMGITEKYILTTNLPKPKKWEHHILLCYGFVYFSSLGIVTLFKWIKDLKNVLKINIMLVIYFLFWG